MLNHSKKGKSKGTIGTLLAGGDKTTKMGR